MSDNSKKPSPEQQAKEKAKQEKMHAKVQKQHAKAVKERNKAKAKQEKDAVRYEKAAAEAREKAAKEKAAAEVRATDPKYLAEKAKQDEKLKAKGRKSIEKTRKRSAKKAKAAEKAKVKLALREEKAAAKAAKGKSGRRIGRAKASSGEGFDSFERSTGIKAARPKRNRNAIICLILAICITTGAAIMLWPPQDKITMGLDIQGGVSVNLSAATTDGSAVTQDQMNEAQKVITARVNASGASASSVQQQGSTSFLVQVPGADDSQAILDTLSSQGVLEFVRVDSIKNSTIQGYIKQGITGMNLKDENIKYTAFMTGDNVSQVNVSRPQGSSSYAVDLTLDSAGTSEFASVSSDLVSSNGQIAILLDGKVESAPAVQSAITNGKVQITGNFTSEEANNLKAIINSGSLPVTLTINQSSIVGPTLGQSALKVGIMAAAVGLILVIIWLLLFYSGLGLLTGVSIIVMGVVYLGLLAMLSKFGWFSLTLPGIAGIIVNIGMAADSSILILECFHEQVRLGKSVKTASHTGVHEGIMTSIDADVVTLISALVLYFFAVGDVRGFGLTLALGIICDLVTMVLFSGPLIRLLAPNIIARHPGFWGMGDDVREGDYISKEVR